jgi:hypothetical protein
MLAQATPDLGGTPTTTWIIVGVLIIVAIAVIAYLVRRSKTEHLRHQFGPEYDRAVEDTGSSTRAEADLAARERRHHELNIRPLTPNARTRYDQEWRMVQARFVDDPNMAIREADRLVRDAMHDRGYPTDDYEQQVTDLSVEHGQDLEHYRRAHIITEKNLDRGASTEELRQAMMHYRALFDSLLGDEVTAVRSAR